MESRAATLREMVGDLRTDLACLASPDGAQTVAERAKSRLADIEALGDAARIQRATQHIAGAIDRVLELKQVSEEPAEQLSEAVTLMEEPMAELRVAVQTLP